MEVIAFIALLVVRANGLTVPGACWWILGIWTAISLAAAWFSEQ